VPGVRAPGGERAARICHVTPHLPPDQSANALLPFQLGSWAAEEGCPVTFITHPPRAGALATMPGAVTTVPRRSGRWLRPLRQLRSAADAVAIFRAAGPALRSADLIHVHSNGLLAEVCGALAHRLGKPIVLTLYGTEIWHYRPRRFGPDLFTRLYRTAETVTFYSQALRERAVALGLDRPNLRTLYPPVADTFFGTADQDRLAARARRGLGAREPILLNVKRLHPLAGQRYLIEALPRVLARVPGTRVVICGTGPLRGELEALARDKGVAAHVTFTGLIENDVIADYCRAADLFVLPSLLEACPTVAVEALAAGTPVVSADHPGGVELHGLFGPDVTLVPKREAGALADAIIAGLEATRRTAPATCSILRSRFSRAAVARTYHEVYASVLGQPASAGRSTE